MSVARWLLFAWFIVAFAAGDAQMAGAKAPGRSVEPVRQIELSEEKIAQYLAAKPALDAILAKAAAAPEPRFMRLLNETARKNGFADYADYKICCHQHRLDFDRHRSTQQKICRGPTRDETGSRHIAFRQGALATRSQIAARYATCANADGRPDEIRGECGAGHQILRQVSHAGRGEGLARAQISRAPRYRAGRHPGDNGDICDRSSW